MLPAAKARFDTGENGLAHAHFCGDFGLCHSGIFAGLQQHGKRSEFILECFVGIRKVFALGAFFRGVGLGVEADWLEFISSWELVIFST